MDRTNPQGAQAPQPEADFEPLDLGIALAMRANGFDEDGIRTVLGYVPDLDMTLDELDAHEDSLGPTGPRK